MYCASAGSSGHGMIEYQRHEPAIFIHVPKTAGTSVRQIFNSWFGDGLLPHYANASTGALPEVTELTHPRESGRPVCLFGHFNQLRGFGIPGRYDFVRQYLTIVREPIEQAISEYFYIRKVGQNWKDQSRVPKVPLESHLASASPNFLNHFPAVVTQDNYRDLIEEKFISVGTTEHLEATIKVFAARLGFKPMTIPRENETPRDQQISQATRESFIERQQLEYLVYDYCRRRLNDQSLELRTSGSGSA